MPETAAVRVAYFAAGAAVVAAVAALSVSGLFNSKGSGDDEERPPIIVRGGSIIFDNGDAGTGKPWKQVKKDWQPDHDKGMPVTKFTVSIPNGGNGCPVLDRTRELAITYTDENGGKHTFIITTRPRQLANGDPGDPAPAIVSVDSLQQPPKVPTQLTYGTSGKGFISNLRFRGIAGYVDCQSPGTVQIWQGN